MSEPLHAYTGLRWYLDVNVVDHVESADLRRMRDLGWLLLETTDTTHTEMRPNPERYDDLLCAKLPMSMGPLVLDHSMLDYAVLGSDEDAERLDVVHRLIFNNRPFELDAAGGTNARHRTRDTMHVVTAIRYGGTGFVTQDADVLDAAARIAEGFNGFTIASIDDATDMSRASIAHARKAAAVNGKPDPSDLPDWP